MLLSFHTLSSTTKPCCQWDCHWHIMELFGLGFVCCAKATTAQTQRDTFTRIIQHSVSQNQNKTLRENSKTAEI